MRKEKPLIQHHVDTQPTISEIPLAQALLDERCMNLSEKEVMDLFEKMMVRSFMSVCLSLLHTSNFKMLIWKYWHINN